MVEYNDVQSAIYISSGHITDQEIPTVISTRLPRPAGHELPTIFITNDLNVDMLDIPDSFESSFSDSDSIDNLNEWVVYSVKQGDVDTYVVSTTSSSLVLLDDINTGVNIKYVGELDYDTAMDLYQAEISYETDSVLNELFLYPELNKFLNEIAVAFRLNISTLCGNRDIGTTVELSEVRRFRLDSSIYCTDSSASHNIRLDLLQEDGRVVFLSDDIFAASKLKLALPGEVSAVGVLTPSLPSDLEIAIGHIYSITSDTFNSGLNISGIKADIKTRSLFVHGFFIQETKFMAANSEAYVDLVDFLYPIVDESIIITVDGDVQSIVIIELGDSIKRVYFNQNSSFYAEGEITVNVYAKNTVGEILDENFFLLYGYDIVPGTSPEFKANDRVFVRAEASNATFCPNKEASAFYFETIDYDSFDLNMTIFPIGSANLQMSIMPQSTAFFYGRTFTVTIDGVKDFNGNLMPPFEYSFTIESPR